MLRFSIAAVLLAGLTAPALAADVYQPPPSATHHGYHHSQEDYLPFCDEPEVLARIAERFAYADARITHSGLAITGVDSVHEHALRASGRSLIDRRYCGGTAWLSDGRSSEVVYLIEAKQGFASFGWKVQSCLPAYDPYRVYGAACRSVRP